MRPQGRAWILAAGGLFLFAGVGLCAAFPGGAQAVAGLLLLGPAVPLFGLGLGPLAALGLALAEAAFTVAAAWMAHGGLPPEAVAAALLLQGAGLFGPRVLARSGRDEERLFAGQHGPVAEERDGLRAELEALRAKAARVEREGREADALFHVGSEMGKLLTLEDTLEFVREILHGTLKRPAEAGDLAFVVALAGDGGGERPGARVEICEGLEASQAQSLCESAEGPFAAWLRSSLEPVLVRSAAAEPALKGALLPPGTRGLLNVPLAVGGRAIGWVLALDLGGGLPDADVENLGILCPQFAIGLEKALLYERLRLLSVTDGLTGLTVHRHFQSRLDEELKRSERYHEPLSLVMADIDHFKRFNDTWGHPVGDQVLKAVAGALKEGLGASELAVRYGGEEFALVLPKTPKDAALERAEALRLRVKALRVPVEGKQLEVTVSLGVSCYPGDAMTKSGLIERADGALYRAKEGGRDRVAAA